MVMVSFFAFFQKILIKISTGITSAQLESSMYIFYVIFEFSLAKVNALSLSFSVCPMGRKIKRICNKKNGVGYIMVFANRRSGCKCRSKLLSRTRVRCRCRKRGGASKRCYRSSKKLVIKRWVYKLRKNVCNKITKTLTTRVGKLLRVNPSRCSPLTTMLFLQFVRLPRCAWDHAESAAASASSATSLTSSTPVASATDA